MQEYAHTHRYLKNIKERNGITLVALVVTIVVLIILATISINIIFGDEGILEKAKQAKEMQANAQEEEKQILADSSNSMEQHITGERETVTIDKEEYESLKAKVEELDEKVNAASTNNIVTYYAGNTNKFNSIELEPGDYLCTFSTYVYGAIDNKPSQYIVSIGNNSNGYKAYSYQMVSGTISYTLSLTPRTESNPKGILDISSTTTGYHQCSIMKIDNGHD